MNGAFRLGIYAQSQQRAPAITDLPSTILCHFDDTTNIMLDSSAHGFSITDVGGSNVTDHVFFGTHSRNNGGSRAQFSNPILQLGTGPFTLDMRLYPGDLSGEKYLFDGRDGGGNTRGFGFFLNGGHLGWYDGSSYIVSSTGPGLTNNQWYHVAITRDAFGMVTLFQDGVVVYQSGATAFHNNFVSQNIVCFAAQYYPVGVEPFVGRIDEFRYIVGTCAWTSGFTPLNRPYLA